VLKAGHVANGRIHPNVKVLIVRAGNQEPKVRRVARDIPGLEPRTEPLRQFVGNLFLQRTARCPFFQKFLILRQIEKVVI